MARLDNAETALVKLFADQFQKGFEVWKCSSEDAVEQAKGLGITPENLTAALATLKLMGAIDDLGPHGDGYGFSCRITPKSVLLARAAIDQEAAKKGEVRDIVAELKTVAKGNPILAWVIIAFVVLAGLVTFVNQLLQLIDRITK